VPSPSTGDGDPVLDQSGTPPALTLRTAPATPSTGGEEPVLDQSGPPPPTSPAPETPSPAGDEPVLDQSGPSASRPSERSRETPAGGADSFPSPPGPSTNAQPPPVATGSPKSDNVEDIENEEDDVLDQSFKGDGSASSDGGSYGYGAGETGSYPGYGSVGAYGSEILDDGLSGVLLVNIAICFL
jgi:hypothetical protein